MMEFERQKPITDEYRKGWERIWNFPAMRETVYPNGCPILSESEPEPRTGPQRDDL